MFHNLVRAQVYFIGCALHLLSVYASGNKEMYSIDVGLASVQLSLLQLHQTSDNDDDPARHQSNHPSTSVWRNVVIYPNKRSVEARCAGTVYDDDNHVMIWRTHETGSAPTSCLSQKQYERKFKDVEPHVINTSIVLGGLWQKQYGHFLLESLPGLHVLSDGVPAGTPLAYMKWFNGYGVEDRIDLGAIFNTSVIFLPQDRPTKVRTVYVPHQSFVIYTMREYFNKRVSDVDDDDRRACVVYQKIAEYAARKHVLVKAPRCIYLSRRGAISGGDDRTISGGVDRTVLNEGWVEELYHARGFFIARPGPNGNWTFEEEVAHYSQAYILAGFSGTNMHNSVFLKKGGIIINMNVVEKRTDVNQGLIDNMSEHTTYKINLVNGYRNEQVSEPEVKAKLDDLADVIHQCSD